MRGDVVSTIDVVSGGVELSRTDESVVNTNVVSGDWETPATELEIEMISDGLLLRGIEVVGSNWIEVDSAVSLVKDGVGTEVGSGGVAVSVLETKDVTCGVSVDSGVRNVVTASVLLVAVAVVAVAVVCVTIVPEIETLSLGVSAKLEVGVNTKLEVSSMIVSVGEGVMVVVSMPETKLCVVS